MFRSVLLASVIAAVVVATGHAQPVRPKATLTASAAESIRPGDTVRLTLEVVLPAGLHVQANKPRDPSLIPTMLTLTPPAGISVVEIGYPKPSTFTLSGRSQVLDVFGEKFSIAVQAVVAPTVSAGNLAVPARLRYQACDASSCFPPATATTEWTLHVTGGSR